MVMRRQSPLATKCSILCNSRRAQQWQRIAPRCGGSSWKVPDFATTSDGFQRDFWRQAVRPTLAVTSALEPLSILGPRLRIEASPFLLCSTCDAALGVLESVCPCLVGSSASWLTRKRSTRSFSPRKSSCGPIATAISTCRSSCRTAPARSTRGCGMPARPTIATSTTATTCASKARRSSSRAPCN